MTNDFTPPFNYVYLYDQDPMVSDLNNTAAINTRASYVEKTQSIAFTTGNNVTSTQMLYEQGGGAIGMNLFIQNQKLYASVFDMNTGSWGNKEISYNIAANTQYVATFTFEGTQSAQGIAKLYVNNELVGSVGGVGILKKHTGDIHVGENGGTLIHGVKANGALTFTGSIEKIIQYNEALESADLQQLHNYMSPTITTPAGEYGLFAGNIIPSELMDGDKKATEVGMKFTTLADGYITGAQFFKGGTANSGTHTGHLWASDGTLLATVTFTNESSNGWQTAHFNTPVAVHANSDYVISYHAPKGHYTGVDYGFTNGISNDYLSASSNAGVYAYGASGTFPTSTYNAENYFVDVVFKPNVAPVAQDDTIQTDEDTPVTIHVLQNDSDADNDALTISNLSQAAHGTLVLNNDNTVTYTPGADFHGSDSFTYTIRDGFGHTDTATVAINVNDTTDYVDTGLWDETVIPQNASANDNSSVELGMRFQPQVNGSITAVQFYKGNASNGGEHTGHLWSADGTLLASVTFSNETASGWQTAYFDTPVDVTANSGYVISYHAPQGNYAGDNFGFSQGLTNPYLSAPTDAGVYAYGSSGSFPVSSYNATNYWVDVVFHAESIEGGDNGGPATGHVYYVATDGSDSGNGSAANPWATINHAMYQNLQPGDTVIVKPGTYTEQVWIANGGSGAGYVNLVSEIPGAALIRPPVGAYSTLNIQADYVKVDGFDVVGGSGHAIDAEGAHHTIISNNIAHDSGGSGISSARGEFILIEDNTVYGNAGTNGFHTSGISVYEARNITGDITTEGYRTIIRGNETFDNITTATNIGEHTDGNGIIIDDFQSTQTAGFPNYIFPTLVDSNLAYFNGGKGIQVTWSDYVTVSNNTVYHNNMDNLNPGTWRGELSNQQSSNNSWVNNIAVTDSSINSNNTAIGDYSYNSYINANTVWENNLSYDSANTLNASVRTEGGSLGPSAILNLLGVNPVFLNPGTDFHLSSVSPAINAGTGHHGLYVQDLDGQGRVAGGQNDIGAYEYDSTSSLAFPKYAVIGDSSSNTLIGTFVSDVLYGAGGSDSLVGGQGADRFVFHQQDTGVDTISDFKASEGDKLDISNLITGFDAEVDSLSDFVRFTASSGDLIVSVNSDGGANNFSDFAVLKNVTTLSVTDFVTE